MVIYGRFWLAARKLLGSESDVWKCQIEMPIGMATITFPPSEGTRRYILERPAASFGRILQG
jgi:hypothetical protein